jgi:hypothetical protein
MKISPVAGPANSLGGVAADVPSQPTGDRDLRRLRLQTNYTPEGRGQPQAEVDERLTTPAPNEGEVVDEASKPLSPQFAALAKQRRALQVKERELQEREKALSAKPSTQEGQIDLARLKSEPLSVLLEAGVTYEQLTEAILADQNGNSSQLRALEAKIAALEEGVDKKLTDREQAQRQAAIAEMQREAQGLVAEGEDFELVRETRSLPKVINLIEKTYDETGEVMSVREALKLFEDELVERYSKLANLQKVQSKLAPQALTQRPAGQMRTLTARDTAVPPMSAKQRAIAAFNGTLRK